MDLYHRLTPTILRSDTPNSWENNLSRLVDRRRSVAPIFRTAVASMGWLVGPLGFEPRTNGL